MEETGPSTALKKPALADPVAALDLARSRPRPGPQPVRMGSAQRQQRLQREDLDQHKGTIKRLFIDENLPLSQVMDIMEKDHGVAVS